MTTYCCYCLGCSRANRALQLNDGSANAHKWYAIMLGTKGEYVQVGEKIQNGYVFKEHVDRALQINPKDPSLHYLLGRFCLEVATLSWMERKLASTLFASPPSSTPQEALEHFLASERLGKPLKDNRFYMAKCYVALQSYELAAHWLKKCVEMPNVSISVSHHLTFTWLWILDCLIKTNLFPLYATIRINQYTTRPFNYFQSTNNIWITIVKIVNVDVKFMAFRGWRTWSWFQRTVQKVNVYKVCF